MEKITIYGFSTHNNPVKDKVSSPSDSFICPRCKHINEDEAGTDPHLEKGVSFFHCNDECCDGCVVIFNNITSAPREYFNEKNIKNYSEMKDRITQPYKCYDGKIYPVHYFKGESILINRLIPIKLYSRPISTVELDIKDIIKRMATYSFENGDDDLTDIDMEDEKLFNSSLVVNSHSISLDWKYYRMVNDDAPSENIIEYFLDGVRKVGTYRMPYND